MKSAMIIRDPEDFQLLGDETRRKIIFLLRVKEMTASQIASELDITPQAVYHHIRKLKKANMIEVSREERVAHLIESYYRATAEAFICRFGKAPISKEAALEQIKTILNALEKIGFKLNYTDDNVSKLTELQKKLNECCSETKHDEIISELDNIDWYTQEVVSRYAETLSMSKDEFLEQQKLESQLRDVLISLITQ